MPASSLAPVSPKCGNCSSPAVMRQRSSGNLFCSDCFIEMFETRVRETINRYSMLSPHDKIAIGVSGGKDSTALLYVLAKIESRYPSATLVPVYIDEGIKGYSELSFPIASEHARKLGLPLYKFKFTDLYGASLDSVIKEADSSAKRLPACSYCGILRRRALTEAAYAVGATKLATGHNLDDEAQTILMNVLRGDVQRIAKNLPETALPHMIPRIKPFKITPEHEIVLYDYYRELAYQTVECPYRAEAFRGDVRAFLNNLETENPNVKQTLVRFSDTLTQALHEHFKEPPVHTCKLCGKPSKQVVCKTCQVLRQLKITYPPAASRRGGEV